jgi:Ulp1 family protease
LRLLKTAALEKIPHKKIFFLNSFFMGSLMGYDLVGFKYDQVKKLTPKESIFRYDVAVVPVNFNCSHWFLLEINMGAQSIKIYDSLMGTTPTSTYIEGILRYLKEEAIDKLGCALDELWPGGWSHEVVVNVPQQNNTTDCGVFMLSFAEKVVFDLDFFVDAANADDYRKKIGVDLMLGQLVC